MANEEETDEKQVRKCGFCGEVGHNQRSCEKRKAQGVSTSAAPSNGKGRPKKAAAMKKGPKPGATAPMVQARSSSTETLGEVSAQDFQEVRQQRTVDGALISAAVRTYGNGDTQVGLRHQRGDEKGSEFPLITLAEATALYVMLGGILQHSKKSQETANPFIRHATNGVTHKPTPQLPAS